MTTEEVSTSETTEAAAATLGDLAEGKTYLEAKEEALAAEKKVGEETAEPEEEAEEHTEPDEEDESEELETEDESQEKPKKKGKGGWQRKLDKKDSKISALEEEKEHWRQEALRAKVPEKKAEAELLKPDLSKKPKAEDFETVEAYEEAKFDWKYEQRRSAEIRESKENAVKTEVETKINQHRSRVDEFSKSKKDWDEITEVFSNTKNISLTLQEAVINSEHGPEMLYELGKDPKELKRILSLTPIQAAMALGKIEARFSKPNPSIEKKPTTKAPPPIKPVRSKGSASDGGYRDDMTLAEYEKWRNDQLKARRAEA